MIEILNAVHNIVSVTPEHLSERHLDGANVLKIPVSRLPKNF